MIRLVVFFLCLITHLTYAQRSGKLIKNIRVKSPVQASVDRLGNFYVLQANGITKKISPEGVLIAQHKGQHVPELLEPWNPLRIFSYYRFAQRLEFWNYELKTMGTEPLDPSIAIQPVLVCPTPENNLWVIDQADRSVKKINQQTHHIDIEFRLSTEAGVPQAMREYQNLLIIRDDKNQIEIYTSVGNRIKYIQGTQIKNFNVAGEDVYYLDGDTIHFYHLFTEEKNQVKLSSDALFAIVTDERLLVVRKSRAEIFAFSF
jgi:hypothetical protein